MAIEKLCTPNFMLWETLYCLHVRVRKLLSLSLAAAAQICEQIMLLLVFIRYCFSRRILAAHWNEWIYDTKHFQQLSIHSDKTFNYSKQSTSQIRPPTDLRPFRLSSVELSGTYFILDALWARNAYFQSVWSRVFCRSTTNHKNWCIERAWIEESHTDSSLDSEAVFQERGILEGRIFLEELLMLYSAWTCSKYCETDEGSGYASWRLFLIEVSDAFEIKF